MRGLPYIHAMTISLIHDGDHGGDDFITTLLFMAYPALFDVRGITTVLGNTSTDQAARNARKALALSHRMDVPVRTGAHAPILIPYQLGDDAFGSDGLGGVAFADAGNALGDNGIGWLADTLRGAPARLTLCVTGPATNVALLLQQHPGIAAHIARIIMMGGGVQVGGNIKPYAEFNFYMDPDAADIVLQSGIPVVLHTLDTTQQTYYGPARQQQILALSPAPLAEKINAVLRITEHLEMKNFGVPGAFFHDSHVAAYMAMPDNYETKQVRARVLRAPHAEAGRLLVEDDPQGPVTLVTHLVDDERFFAFLCEGIKRILALHPDHA